MASLYDISHKYFEVITAENDELLENVHRLRYQVLCEEKRLPGFEAAPKSNRKETDHYDRDSVHVLLRHLPTQEFIGTARLILASRIDFNKKLPIELHTRFDPGMFSVDSLQRTRTAEISRFLVVKKFSQYTEGWRQSSLGTVNDEVGERTKANRNSSLSIALILSEGIVRLSVKYNIINLLSIMDPSLNRLLGFYGLNFDPIGSYVEYHGLRRPYYLNLKNLLARIHRENFTFWEVLTNRGKWVVE